MLQAALSPQNLLVERSHVVLWPCRLLTVSDPDSGLPLRLTMPDLALAPEDEHARSACLLVRRRFSA